MRNIYIENVPLETAIDQFFNHLKNVDFFKLDTETIDVLDALDRVTGEPVYARRSSPHYPAAAMDGIAVKAASTFTANEFNPVKLKHNLEYIEVDTGDYVPRQYDAVIMIEDVNFYEEYAEIIKPAVPWQNVRSVGEDLVAHDMILPALTVIGPHEIGVLLTAASNQLNVIRKPVVSIIPTGTELVDSGSSEMAPGIIVESNSRMLAGLCSQWGAIPERHEIVVDNKELLRQAVESAKNNADIIVICSGSSAGREDFTSSIINDLGEVLIHGIAIRPGKPAILGIIDNKPVIGVPGYPVSAELVFNLFARPLIYRKQGLIPPEPIQLECMMARKIASTMGVDEFINVNVARIKDHYICYPLNRGAGITTSLVKADGKVCISRGNEGIQAKEPCTVYLKHPQHIIDKTIVTIGSHDLCIDHLIDMLYNKHNIRLVSTNAGSMGGIMALLREESHFAGIHLLDPETGDYNLSYLQKYLPNQRWMLINLVKRQQGLVVKKGNPLGIKSLQHLADSKIRYINRQKGAGTRVLFDYLLTQSAIEPNAIYGYEREEYTHLAVAAAVKNDTSDAGMAIYASAKALNLDFIPLAEERYDLCILPDLFTEAALETLLATISSDDFKKRALAAGGYSTDLTGTIITSNL